MHVTAKVTWKDVVFDEAFLKLVQVSGSVETGWNGQVRVWKDQASFEKGTQHITEMQVNVQGATQGGPGPFGGANQELREDAEGPSPVTGSRDPYAVLYPKLLERFPKTGKYFD